MENNSKKRFTTKQIVLGGLLIALSVVMGFYNLYLPPNGSRVTFRFIPLIYSSIILGPVMGAIIGGVSDWLIYFMTPGSPGGFFPGFTVTAILMGFFPGYIIKKRLDASWVKVILVCVISFLLTWILDSYWLSILVGKAYMFYMTVRFIPNIIQAIITAVVLMIALKRIKID